MARVPLVCEVELYSFKASLSVPLDLKPREAARLKEAIDGATVPPSESLKVPMSDPGLDMAIVDG